MDKRLSEIILEKIFTYDNYRTFLQEYFTAVKEESRYFSQRAFTKRAGFSAHNFVTFVMQGKRNLSLNSIQKMKKGLKLTGRKADFFEYLVLLNQAKSLEDKEQYYSKLKTISHKTEFYKLNGEQFFFYEKWYYPVVRELMVLPQWNGNVAKLAKMVRPTISIRDAQEAVDKLVSSGMVIKDGDTYELKHHFVTSANVPAYIKKKSRRDVLLKGVETIDAISPQEKYTSYATVPMSKELYQEVRGMMNELREKILAKVADDKICDEVYEVVLQTFPVSNLTGDK